MRAPPRVASRYYYLTRLGSTAWIVELLSRSYYVIRSFGEFALLCYYPWCRGPNVNMFSSTCVPLPDRTLIPDTITSTTCPNRLSLATRSPGD